MAEIGIEKIMFPRLYKFLDRSRIFNIYAYRSHTYVALFVDVEKWGVMQWRFFGGSPVACQSEYGKTAFVSYPKHCRYLCLSVGYAQTVHKIQLPLLCFCVP